VHERGGRRAGRLAGREAGGQHAVDDHQLGPQLRHDVAHVECKLGPSGGGHELGGLLLERGVHLGVATASVTDNIEARVHGRLASGGRSKNADTVIASGEQLARGEERRQIPSATPAHNQNVTAR
jgi:hypothetical protein